MIKIAFIDLNDSVKVGEISSNLYLATYLLKKTGDKKYFEVELFSSFCAFKKSKKRYDVVCFSANGYNLDIFSNDPYFLKLVNQINALKVIGGPGPTIQPTLALNIADIVVLGEGEKVFYNLMNEFVKNENEYKYDKNLFLEFLKKSNKINNIVFKLNNEIIFSDQKYLELEFYPRDFELITDFERYIENWPYLDYMNEKIRGISIITSRSCAFNCSFCQPTLRKIFGNKVRFIPISVVIEELKHVYFKYNVNSFMIHDDTFTMNKKHVLSFCYELINLKKEGVRFNWICNSRADTLDEDMIKIMKEAGCVEVRLGIETWNEVYRNEYLQKKISSKKIDEAIYLLKKYDLKIMGFFMLGFENQKIKEILREIITTSNSELDLVSYSILTPLPGTYLGEKYHIKKFYNYYYSNKINPSKINKKLLEFFRILGFLIFYFHHKRLTNTIKSIFNKGMRYKIKRLFTI